MRDAPGLGYVVWVGPVQDGWMACASSYMTAAEVSQQLPDRGAARLTFEMSTPVMLMPTVGVDLAVKLRRPADAAGNDGLVRVALGSTAPAALAVLLESWEPEQGPGLQVRRDGGRCPVCDSPSPTMHPAVQAGGEVFRCLDPFHGSGPARAELAEVQTRADLDWRFFREERRQWAELFAGMRGESSESTLLAAQNTLIQSLHDQRRAAEAERDEARGRLHAAAQDIGAVFRIHVSDRGASPFCEGCGTSYPCETVRALGLKTPADRRRASGVSTPGG